MLISAARIMLVLPHAVAVGSVAGDRRAWCEANLGAQYQQMDGAPLWYGPMSGSGWDGVDRRMEVWLFARCDDAVLFDMVWG